MPLVLAGGASVPLPPTRFLRGSIEPGYFMVQRKPSRPGSEARLPCDIRAFTCLRPCIDRIQDVSTPRSLG